MGPSQTPTLSMLLLVCPSVPVQGAAWQQSLEMAGLCAVCIQELARNLQRHMGVPLRRTIRKRQRTGRLFSHRSNTNIQQMLPTSSLFNHSTSRKIYSCVQMPSNGSALLGAHVTKRAALGYKTEQCFVHPFLLPSSANK